MGSSQCGSLLKHIEPPHCEIVHSRDSTLQSGLETSVLKRRVPVLSLSRVVVVIVVVVVVEYFLWF